MTDFNSTHNRIVWCDIPVADLDRAASFYKIVLNIEVHKEKYEQTEFCILDHKEGNGACLFVQPESITSEGFLVYFNVDKRIQDATVKVGENGGKIVQPIHAIGPHGYRTVVIDSEGNKIALHSTVDS